MHRKLTDGPADARKAGRSWRKVPWSKESWRMLPKMHGKLREIDGRAHGRTESWRKLTEGPAAARKVDGWSRGYTKCCQKLVEWCTESWCMLTEGLADGPKVDGNSHECTESWWKLTQQEVDGKWQKVLRLHRMLTKGSIKERFPILCEIRNVRCSHFCKHTSFFQFHSTCLVNASYLGE